jgi:hypothetical protein
MFFSDDGPETKQRRLAIEGYKRAIYSHGNFNWVLLGRFRFKRQI